MGLSKKMDTSAFNGTAGAGNKMDLMGYMKRGAVPPELLGVHGNKHGGSQFSSIAHTAEQQQKFLNLANNSVDDEIIFQVMGTDATGKKVPKTNPFEFGGKILKPDEKGFVRITDKGRVDMTAKIAAYRRKRTNDLMEIVRLGDDIAQYVFGISAEKWKKLCAKEALKSGSNETKALLQAMNMHKDLGDLECSVEFINSLPPSLTQTQAIAKLRKIVEYYEKNVNMEEISTIADELRNMNDGHNVVKEHMTTDDVTKAVNDAVGAPPPAGTK